MKARLLFPHRGDFPTHQVFTLTIVKIPSQLNLENFPSRITELLRNLQLDVGCGDHLHPISFYKRSCLEGTESFACIAKEGLVASLSLSLQNNAKGAVKVWCG